ncbi:hypothetical protein KLVAMA180M_26035 [Klebsiella variicola subsp. variicola]
MEEESADQSFTFSCHDLKLYLGSLYHSNHLAILIKQNCDMRP